MNVTDVNYVSSPRVLSMCIQNYCPPSNDRFAWVYVARARMCEYAPIAHKPIYVHRTSLALEIPLIITR